MLGMLFSFEESRVYTMGAELRHLMGDESFHGPNGLPGLSALGVDVSTGFLCFRRGSWLGTFFFGWCECVATTWFFEDAERFFWVFEVGWKVQN